MRDRNQVVLPFDYEIKIGEKEPVRKLVEICDELDYSELYGAYVRKWRKVDPRTMFEVLSYAYMNGIYSSRDIEHACRYDIRFMWILQNEPAPDHSTIARFQNERLAGVMEGLFYFQHIFSHEKDGFYTTLALVCLFYLIFNPFCFSSYILMKKLSQVEIFSTCDRQT